MLLKKAEFGISVIMPVHNGGSFLENAVRSILKQENVLLELIIIDDHSTDNAIHNLDGRLKNDVRVRIIPSPSKGIVPALNEGIKQSRYSIIVRMDDDDIAAPERLHEQLKMLLSDSNVHIIGAQIELFSHQHSIAYGYRRYQDWINQQCSPEQIHQNFFVESCIPHPTAMMSKQVLLELGGYHDSRWPEDYDLWCRAFIKGYRFAKPNNKILLKWRDYPHRTSRIEQRYNKQEFIRCKAHYLSQHLKSRNINECLIWGTGPTGNKLHKHLCNNGINVTGFIDINPKLRNRLKHEKPIHLISTPPTEKELTAINAVVIIAVSAWGAREKIKSALLDAGLIPGADFILAA